MMRGGGEDGPSGSWRSRRESVTQRSSGARGGEATPRVENVQALANALQVQTAWLIDGREPMVLPGQMTVTHQFRMHTGPGTEGRPGYVIVEPGPWQLGDDGEWQAVDAELAQGVR